MRRIVLFTIALVGLGLVFSVSAMAGNQMGTDQNVSGAMSPAPGTVSYSPEPFKDFTQVQYDSMKLVGQSKDQLVGQMGQPEFVADDGAGLVRYHYIWRSSAATGPIWVTDDFVLDSQGNVVKYFLTEQ
jgi:hypothetical protein